MQGDCVGHAVNKDSRVGVSVVVPSQRAEPLHTSCVPYAELCECVVCVLLCCMRALCVLLCVLFVHIVVVYCCVVVHVCACQIQYSGH